MPWILEKVRENRGAFPAGASEPVRRPELPSNSEIEAATVHVAGRDVGETPIVTTVDCDLGQDIEVLVEKSGYFPIRRAVPCRGNSLVAVSFKLRR